LTGHRVSVVGTGDGVEAAVRRSVDLLGGLRMAGGEHVVIKPNVCNAKNPYGMVNTDPRVLEAVVDLVRDKAGRITVVESDNISGTAEMRIEGSGFLNLLEGLGVEFLNLSGDDYEAHEVAGVELHLPRTVLEADLFVNLPKIKTCGHTLVTLSIKNLFGVIQRRRKNRLHGRLDEVLPYLARTIRSDLIVVDGVTAMEGNGPVIGTPREMGVVVAGSDPVSVDAVCSAMMGFDPAGIAHIARAHEMGFGELDPHRIEVVGDDWRKFAGEFERPYSLRATLKSVKTIGKVYF
jgi:uncharacterized protein (DUF362 family)